MKAFTLDLPRAFFFEGSSTSDDNSESLFWGEDDQHLEWPRKVMVGYLIVRYSA
jgi:hypothetical protein